MRTSPVQRAFCLGLAASLVWTASAFASLGESVKEVTARFGPGGAVHAQPPAEEAQIYVSGGMQILVQFWKGQSCSEHYRKVDAGELSGDDQLALLKASAGGSSWSAVTGDTWTRADFGAVAFLGDKRRVLVVQSYVFHAEVQKLRKQTEGFGGPAPRLFPKELHPAVTKIVFRYVAPRIPPGSFAAKQKTAYLAGDRFARIEEAPEPERHRQNLLICSEPDIWMINLDGRQGNHVVDEGTDLVVHNPLMRSNAPGDLASLEVGKEMEFFRAHKIAPNDEQVIDGQSYDVLEYKQGNYRVVMNVAKETHKPFQINFFKDNQPDFSIIYISYETGLPFREGLFVPPPDVTLTEGKPAAP